MTAPAIPPSLRYVIEKLVEDEPWVYDTYYGGYQCYWCEVDRSDRAANDGFHHENDCAWASARLLLGLPVSPA